MNKQYSNTGESHLQVISGKGKTILSFSMKIGHWKHLFEEEKYKWIIAKALNTWVGEENPLKLYPAPFELAGYMIANGKIGLVLKIEKKDLKKELARVNELLNDIITKNLKTDQEELFASFQDEDDSPEGIKFHHLFERKTPMNHYLVKLITGRPVKLPYYNIRLARLEEWIRNYNFCSAIDYAGATSPVKVSLLSNEELDRLERTHDN